MTEAKTSSSRGARRKRLVLIGAGHAHLYTLKRAVEIGRRGSELIAIAPESFWYSGLATGVLGGHYAAEQDQVDVETLVKRGGGQFIRARIVAIEPAARRVRLGDGATIGYDVLSLNLGSETFRLTGETERVFPIKPLRNLWGLRQSLEAAQAAGHTPRVVIAGGGASGCEIAANVRALLGRSSEITILARGPALAPSFPPSATRALMRWLDEQGIDVRVESGVSGIDGNAAVTERGERFPFDYMVNATGLHASAILAQSGLPVSAHGELQVDEFLRSTGDARIFGGGDCVCFSRTRPRENRRLCSARGAGAFPKLARDFGRAAASCVPPAAKLPAYPQSRSWPRPGVLAKLSLAGTRCLLAERPDRSGLSRALSTAHQVTRFMLCSARRMQRCTLRYLLMRRPA